MKFAVDPGHGMSNRTKNVYDSGATHNEAGTQHEEATIALKYGLSLWDAFRLAGQEVFMTRDDETDHAPVGERAGNAETARCNAFISLHLNDDDNDNAHGLEVLYRGDDDIPLARALLDALIGVSGLRNRGIKHRPDLAVLKFNGKAVLIELGFIANDGDRETLLNPAMREAVCAAIVRTTVAQLGGTITPGGGPPPTPPSPGLPPVAVAVPPHGKRVVSSSDGEANVRNAPKKTGALLRVLHNGDIVGIYAMKSGWSRIAFSAEEWVSDSLLKPVATPSPGGGGTPSGSGLEGLMSIAASSVIAGYRWKDRSVAPVAYMKGMALVYARVYCKYRAGDPAALEMGKAATGNAAKDALSHYASAYSALGMDNSSDGVDTLRHLFALLLGLGMRESSGKHCCGRDTTATNTTAETAEAGMFQTSWNARSSSPLLTPLFRQYSASPSGFLEVFSAGVTCNAANWENFGSGDGKAFQQLSKECPAFAAEFAAIALRKIRAHWGPIVRREVELKADADAMFLAVQNDVDASGLCPI